MSKSVSLWPFRPASLQTDTDAVLKMDHVCVKVECEHTHTHTRTYALAEPSWHCVHVERNVTLRYSNDHLSC